MTFENTKLPSSFCVAPWIHAHLDSTANRRLCCIADVAPPEVSQLSWSKFKNSDYLKNIRKQMLEGKSPSECWRCEKSNSHTTNKTRLNHVYQYSIDSIIEKTDSSTGATEAKIKYIDYRSQLCNLKCRSCSPGSSSAYQKFLKNQPTHFRDSFFDPEHFANENLPELFNQKYLPEMQSMLLSEEVDRIYFAGGEPVIEPGHIPLLQNLRDSEKSIKIELFYNTNLSYSQVILKKWISLLKDFGIVIIYASVDGTGEICDYLRAGSKFSQIESNIDYVTANKSPNISFVLDITLNSLNMFYLKEFSEFAIQKKIAVDAKLMISNESTLPILRPERIPSPIKQKIIQDWRNYFNSLNSDDKIYLEYLDLTINIFEASEIKDFHKTEVVLDMLKKFEFNLYGENNKFFELLEKKPLGKDWSNQLRSSSVA